MRLLTSDRFVRWKRDIQIAAAWINTPFLFLTLASLMYSFTSVIRNNLAYWQFLLLAGLIFVPLYKAIGRIIIGLGIYGKERTYDISIDPFSIDKLTPKERKMMIPVTIVSMRLNLKYLSHYLTHEEKARYESAIKVLEDAIQK